MQLKTNSGVTLYKTLVNALSCALPIYHHFTYSDGKREGNVCRYERIVVNMRCEGDERGVISGVTSGPRIVRSNRCAPHEQECRNSSALSTPFQ